MVYPMTMESHEFSGHSSEILVIHRKFVPYILKYMIGFCVLLVIPLYLQGTLVISPVIDQWIRWQVDPLTDVFSWLHLTTSWPLLIIFHYVQGKSFSLHDIQDSECCAIMTFGTLRPRSWDPRDSEAELIWSLGTCFMMFPHVPGSLRRWFNMFPLVPGWLGSWFTMFPNVPGWPRRWFKMFPRVPEWLGKYIKVVHSDQSSQSGVI